MTHLAQSRNATTANVGEVGSAIPEPLTDEGREAAIAQATELGNRLRARQATHPTPGGQENLLLLGSILSRLILGRTNHRSMQ